MVSDSCQVGKNIFWCSKQIICWRCGAAGTDYFHIWWHCLIITSLGEKIRLKIQEILTIKIPLNVHLFLLYDFQKWESGKKYAFMVAHLLSASFLLIAAEWKQPHAPSLTKWEVKARYMLVMAKITAIAKYRNGNLNKINQFCQ